MSLHLPVAGIGSRFLALAIDTLFQIFWVVVLVLILSILGPGTLGERGNWVLAAVIVVIFLLYYGYFAVFEILWSGQTPGKRIVGIRVIKDSGRPLTAGETIGRNLMRIIDQLPAFYAVGILVALLNRQHQRLGDLLVGSILVREAELKDLKSMWHAPTDAAPGRHVDTSGLTPEDLNLIDAFLARRYSLTAGVRSSMAAQIFSRLRPKLPTDLDAADSVEQILETLSYNKRSTKH